MFVSTIPSPSRASTSPGELTTGPQGLPVLSLWPQVQPSPQPAHWIMPSPCREQIKWAKDSDDIPVVLVGTSVTWSRYRGVSAGQNLTQNCSISCSNALAQMHQVEAPPPCPPSSQGPGPPPLPGSSTHCPFCLHTRQLLYLWLQLRGPLAPTAIPVTQQPLKLWVSLGRRASKGGQDPGLGQHSSWGRWRSPERAALSQAGGSSDPLALAHVPPEHPKVPVSPDLSVGSGRAAEDTYSSGVPLEPKTSGTSSPFVG